MKINELRQDSPSDQIRTITGSIRGSLLHPDIDPSTRETIRELTFALDLVALHVVEAPWSKALSRRPRYTFSKRSPSPPTNAQGETLKPGAQVWVLSNEPLGRSIVQECETLEVWYGVLTSDLEILPPSLTREKR